MSMYLKKIHLQANIVSNKETYKCFYFRYKVTMQDWIKQAIAFKAGDGYGSQTAVVSLLAEKCGWTPTRGKLNKLLSGRQEPSASDLYDISYVTGYPVPPSKTPDEKLSEFLQLYSQADEIHRSVALDAAMVYIKAMASPLASTPE